MKIHLLLSADTLPLESERCWRLVLAVYELVTNAVRHACFDGRDGEIKIKLMRAGSWVNCRVTDNGSGLGRIKPGRVPSLSRATPSAVSEHSSELIGCPIPRSLTTSCVRLELRSLPSTGITRLHQYYEPLRIRLRIVGELAKGPGGRMGHTFGTTWTSFALDFPLTEREQHANRVVAGRRPRTGRRLKTMSPASVPVAGERANSITIQSRL
jgi:hypothetical protein